MKPNIEKLQKELKQLQLQKQEVDLKIDLIEDTLNKTLTKSESMKLIGKYFKYDGKFIKTLKYSVKSQRLICKVIYFNPDENYFSMRYEFFRYYNLLPYNKSTKKEYLSALNKAIKFAKGEK